MDVEGNGLADIGDRSFDFAVRIVKLCRYLDEQGGVTRRLSGQLFDSGTSIGANVQEGKAGHSRKDFINKYTVALKEARETVYWLKLLIASELVAAQKVKDLLDEADAISRIVAKSVVTAKARAARL